jgi:hypothetical protein
VPEENVLLIGMQDTYETERRWLRSSGVPVAGAKLDRPVGFARRAVGEVGLVLARQQGQHLVGTEDDLQKLLFEHAEGRDLTRLAVYEEVGGYRSLKKAMKMGRQAILDELLTAFVEPKLIEPTILHDYPIELSPFARATDDDPSIVERFEYFVGGMELGNAFSELNDSEEQAQRFYEERVRPAAEAVGVLGGPGRLVSFMQYPELPKGVVGVGSTHHFAFVVESPEELRAYTEMEASKW